jgi:hypothetical protein
VRAERATSSLPEQDAALPRWITPALINETKEVWQKEYEECLTTADAVGLLQNMGGVFEIMFEDEPDEEQCDPI